MGNCLVMEKKVIKIMRNDGKVLEYREPISVHHILTQFTGHSLFDNNYNNTTCYQHHHHQLLPDAKLLSGRLYYLIPTKINKKKNNNKKVTFASPEVEEDDGHDDSGDESKSDENKNGSNVVRMKIVVHKQELEKLLQGGSVHEIMVYQSLEKQHLLSGDDTDDDDLECNRCWRPMLDCIPESD